MDVAPAARSTRARRIGSPMSRRASLRHLLRRAFIVGSAMAVCFGMHAPMAATPVKLATTTWIGYGPFYVAEAMGFYSKYGVDAHLQTFSDPALLPPALASA